ncbi:uncharacterized protein ACN427_013084 [Glossina fuscipes fuscipes]
MRSREGRKLKSSLYFPKFSECEFFLASAETWLNSDLHSSELFHDSFQVYRKYRLDSTGDSVLISLSAAVSLYSDEFPTPPGIEVTNIRAKIVNKHSYVTCSYIFTNANVSTYKKHAALICNVAKKSEPTDTDKAFGDFNLPQVTWRCSDNSDNSDKAVVFFNDLFDSKLLQYNRTSNCSGTLLYLCFANFPEIAVNGRQPYSLPGNPHHRAICTFFHYDDALHYSNVPNPTSSNEHYDFNETNILLLNSHLSYIMLDFSAGNIENLGSSFYNVLNLDISTSVQIKHSRQRSKWPPWFNKRIKYYKNGKNKFKKINEKWFCLRLFRYFCCKASL